MLRRGLAVVEAVDGGAGHDLVGVRDGGVAAGAVVAARGLSVAGSTPADGRCALGGAQDERGGGDRVGEVKALGVTVAVAVLAIALPQRGPGTGRAGRAAAHGDLHGTAAPGGVDLVGAGAAAVIAFLRADRGQEGPVDVIAPPGLLVDGQGLGGDRVLRLVRRQRPRRATVSAAAQDRQRPDHRRGHGRRPEESGERGAMPNPMRCRDRHGTSSVDQPGHSPTSGAPLDDRRDREGGEVAVVDRGGDDDTRARLRDRAQSHDPGPARSAGGRDAHPAVAQLASQRDRAASEAIGAAVAVEVGDVADEKPLADAASGHWDRARPGALDDDVSGIGRRRGADMSRHGRGAVMSARAANGQ